MHESNIGRLDDVCSYIDDLVCWCPSYQIHLEHLREIFTHLWQNILKLKASKCKFLKEQLQFLGNLVTSQGVIRDDEKIQSIKYMQPPEPVHEVRGFWGTVGFYRHFIPNFADIARPLTTVTCKHAHFHWDEMAQNAFDVLRHWLMESPILAYPHIFGSLKLSK